MNKEDFVSDLQTTCLTVELSVLSELEEKDDVSVYEGLARRSRWFRSLKSADKEMVRAVLRYGLHCMVFHVLCNLDGVGNVAGTPEQGMYVLKYIKGSTEVDLTDADGEYLHDLFRILMDPLYE